MNEEIEDMTEIVLPTNQVLYVPFYRYEAGIWSAGCAMTSASEAVSMISGYSGVKDVKVFKVSLPLNVGG